VDTFNGVANFIFNIIFYIFTNLNPIWGMIFISFITGIAMLFIFKRTSDQDGIKMAKNHVKAHFLAIRLYKDDLKVMMETMKNILLSNLLYMKKSLRPMLFLIVPMAIILIQIAARYEHRPLRVGESTIVTLTVDKQKAVNLYDVELELPDAFSLDIPPVRVMQLRQINWRITAKKPGIYDLIFKSNNREVKKRIQIENGLKPVSPSVAQDQIAVTLLNPAESSLPAESFASAISVIYPEREFHFLGFNFHWLIAFFIFSMVSAFSFKSFLGVEV